MDIATLAAAKRYTNETVIGMGALKGTPCTVKSVTPVTGGNEVILSWTATDGSVTENSFTVKDGISVVGVSIDTTTNNLVVELSDGSTKNAGVLPKGEKGDTGFSPTITENPDNTNEIYKLDVTNEDGTFTTPNLKGTGGGLDPDKYYDKTQINALVEPLDEAKHTHDNKDTVLDKLTTNDTGDTLLFNGNAIKGSVEIDDTTVEATDKVWSAKKTNDTFEEVKQSTADTVLASVKAIKDFVAVEMAKIPAAVDYTVTITDETAGAGEKTKQTIKQGKTGEETTVGTITIPDLVMAVKGTPNDGYLKTYQFTYGTGATFEVDIPKDLVVTAGEVIVVDDEHPVASLTNGTYLKLTIANQTAPVYINVKDLADVYTGKTETTGVSVAISASNEISATLVGKAVTEDNLDDTVTAKINGADEALTWGAIS